MRILAFDSVGGAAGDMILAAMIDLGVDTDQLNRDLSSLGIGSFKIAAQPCSNSGLHGLQLNISLPTTDRSQKPEQATGSPACDHPHSHHHAHAHDHHGDASHPHPHPHPHEHDHKHNPAQDGRHDVSGDHQSALHPGEHGGRGLRDIRALINASSLPQPVKDASIAVFQRLAEAEARVHHCDTDTIHFHEVGALDSILDIVGCCLARYRLDIDAVHVSPLPLGCGTFQCDHGILPIPAPATVELLRDFPVTRTNEPYELVTPTGAAILTAWNSPPQSAGTYRILDTGHGFGTRTLQGRPNLLRATLMSVDAEKASDDAATSCVELACNIDDMTPELIGPLIPCLIEAGALDAFITPVQMKKMRPGCLLTVLCRSCDRTRLMDLLFDETTTFGIRWRSWERETLARRSSNVTTRYGTVRMKIGSRNGRDCVHAPEYEDCRQRALENKVSIREVYAAAMAADRSRAAPE